MSPVVFRQAERNDLEAVVALLADDDLGQMREDARLPLDACYLNAFLAIASDPNQLLAVADAQGTVVGCLQISFLPGLTRKGMWRGQIEGVRIARTHRNQGLGRAFFEWAIATCQRRGCGLVQLSTDKTRPEAHVFYKSLGFQASHEGMKRTL